MDNIHTQSPWLLQPPKGKKPGKPDKTGRPANVNAFIGSQTGDSTTQEQRDKAMKDKQAVYGPCPACGKSHTFKGRNGNLVASSRMDTCKKFLAKTPDQMVDFVLEKNACTRCLSWMHVRADCPSERMACPVKHDDTVCGRPHHKLLHKSKRPAIVNCARTSLDGDDILAPLLQVNINGVDLIAMLDPGSNTTIVRHDAAAKLKAKSRFVQERVKLAGKPEETQDTCLYTFNWDINGNNRTIQALGMCEVTDTYGPR